MPQTSNSESTKNRNPYPTGKLGKLIDEYKLNELGDKIETYWLSDADERYSLRELAEYVNHRLLHTVIQEADMNPLDGEVENTYRLLTDDNVSTGTRTQARRRLERAGVDVDQLESDFVSRQAVHTYLTKDREVSYTPNEGDPLEREATNIRRLKRRMSTITGGKLEQLRNADQLTLGEFEAYVDVRVLCEDCGTQYQVDELLDNGACDCSNTT